MIQGPPSSTPQYLRAAIREFVSLAYPLGQDLDLELTSWWRSRSHNREVGGVESSQHLLGLAWDVAGADQDEFARRARMRGLTVVDEGDHVHVQRYPAGVIPAWVYDQVLA